MKVFITHDANGRITTMGAPPDRFAAAVDNIPMHEQMLTVVEIPDVQHPHFQKYLHEFRVEIRSGKPALVKK